MNAIQTEVIFLNLLRQTDELILSIIGRIPDVDAGSFRARLISLFTTFNGNKTGFAASSFSLGLLANLLKEYAAFKMQSVESVGIPEILTTVQTWEDLPGKPATFPPSDHAHPWSQITYKPISYPPSEHTHPAQVVEWDDITEKPTTFEPATHAHDYASITDKPTTFEPATHAHDYASITDKPTTFEPATHAHDYASITDKPTTFEPATHLHQNQAAVVNWTNGILGKPETFPPAAHNHSIDWVTEVVNKQASYPPAPHTHNIAWGEVSGKPELRRVTGIGWTGTGEINRVITLPFEFGFGVLNTDATCGGRVRPTGVVLKFMGGAFTAFSFNQMSMTIIDISANELNKFFILDIFSQPLT